MNEELTDYQIWRKAGNGDPSILSDPRISRIKDFNGNTPLHYLADGGVKEVLKHPDVSILKNEYDNTPLHFLAHRGVKEAWFHPDFDKVKNKYNETPKNVWIIYEHKPVTCVDFIK